ncbi:DUF1415 domain-containing protein [bacterium]|nr:DUF1415 domain-containing protein [bacterium]
MVIGLNLCPFARKEWVQKRVRLVVSEARSEDELLLVLQKECDELTAHPEIETTLLIHPWVLEDFWDYNQFLDGVDNMLIDNELEGIYQVASFHPNYQFAGTEPDDVENATNRSPFPVLHILREESLERAIASFPDPELIPERNIALLQSMGKERVEALVRSFGGFQAR